MAAYRYMQDPFNHRRELWLAVNTMNGTFVCPVCHCSERPLENYYCSSCRMVVHLECIMSWENHPEYGLGDVFCGNCAHGED